ncbi:LysM domain-containing protein [Paenarthrobacter sp. 4246]|uniref:LysM peptidoglycan-binding domain-containing protein n=1 Tax=Paenarthrobacter sp. 4246 TaxID=3156456 RepID=UPI003399CA71
MGLLDNLKKNLGLGDKGRGDQLLHGGKDHRDDDGSAAREAAPAEAAAPTAPAAPSAGSQAAEDAAAVEVSAADREAAEAAAAQAAQQQAAADAAAAREARQEGLEPDAPEVRPQAQEAAAEAAAVAGQPGPVAPRVTEVVVEQGDTLSGIAAQFGVDLGALIAANADTVPNPDRIYPGQVLRLP